MTRRSATTDSGISPEPTFANVAAEYSDSASLETPESSGMQSPRRRLATQFVGSVGVAFAIVGLQMGQGILLARLLGPVGRGEYATAVFLVQMLLYVGLLGGLEVICRHAAQAEIQLAQLRRAALWLGLTTGAITTAAALGLSFVGIPAEKQYLIPLAIV
ncbi:MAG: hypothetical protein AAGJ83_04610, partial [Planctomycetota bacterium]